jgi:hypothetical protein
MEGHVAAPALDKFQGLFGDEIYYSTDLNRRAGEVLDNARKGPVTISRNKEQFALLRREEAAGLFRAVCHIVPIFEVLQGALSAVEGKEPPASLAWLKAFDLDDTRKMIREILVGATSALQETGDWDAVSATIHEWHESSIVALSGVFEEAMNSPKEELPLTDPRSALSAEQTLEECRK